MSRESLFIYEHTNGISEGDTMMIRARIEGNAIKPLDPIPFKEGDIVTIRFEKGLYSLLQELGSLTASSDIDAVLNDIRSKKYYD